MDWFGLKDFLIACVIFVPLERLVAMHPEQKIFRRDWRNDLICLFLNGFLIKLGLLILIIVWVVAVAGWLVPASFQAAAADQPYWLQVAEMIVISDIGFYCAHRAFHTVPWLWKFHQIHHSIEELDWLAAARVHPIDQILTKGASLLPIFAVGFSEIAIGMYLMLYYWQSFLIHANVRIRFGPLRWVLASPEFHHWHHSNHHEARNKNFAGQLPVLDLLLGTLHMPRGKVPERYGIDEQVPRTYVSQLLHPFRSGFENRGKAPEAVDDLVLMTSGAPPRVTAKAADAVCALSHKDSHKVGGGVIGANLGHLSSQSCAGLTRASIFFAKQSLRRWMDCRVKPGNDDPNAVAFCIKRMRRARAADSFTTGVRAER